ncbi:MAG TPA: ATP synthase F0 subunit B [Thermoanaerobaculales bacterium]|nr:ATP synthase F0 subunit B [Thermoanaerobaculales bacterium]HPA82206.1 ATP synthase F0 subunit B [Thermoanaerobaculales bacterium]HQL28843.1 ATP synthase F0 subunit B [Thermoanaerobaculales bacterium]HQN97614.1 ATP synthase F0 subunit B [Thermoanaerobaculales bacterium]HQP42269.1 ATP synthase F0 subunit B [Thermoanaerobaculales bacterium]
MTPPNLSLLLVMICFWCTMWLVHRFLIRPVGEVLEERRGRIGDAAARWEATHREYLAATERLEGELQNAARAAAVLRGGHRQRALDSRQAALERARSEADDRLGHALATLDAESAAARTELQARAGELARLFAARLLGREVAS